MTEIIKEYFPWFIVLIVLLLILFKEIINETIKTHYIKPKFKLDKNGYVMFYYPPFEIWEYVSYWSNKEENRIIEVYDTIRNVKSIVAYKGPGRCKIKMHCDNPEDMLSKTIRKKLTYDFKNAEELWNIHCEVIEKENKILKEVINNKLKQ